MKTGRIFTIMFVFLSCILNLKVFAKDNEDIDIYKEYILSVSNDAYKSDASDYYFEYRVIDLNGDEIYELFLISSPYDRETATISIYNVENNEIVKKYEKEVVNYKKHSMYLNLIKDYKENIYYINIVLNSPYTAVEGKSDLYKLEVDSDYSIYLVVEVPYYITNSKEYPDDITIEEKKIDEILKYGVPIYLFSKEVFEPLKPNSIEQYFSNFNNLENYENPIINRYYFDESITYENMHNPPTDYFIEYPNGTYKGFTFYPLSAFYNDYEIMINRIIYNLNSHEIDNKILLPLRDVSNILNYEIEYLNGTITFSNIGKSYYIKNNSILLNNNNASYRIENIENKIYVEIDFFIKELSLSLSRMNLETNYTNQLEIEIIALDEKSDIYFTKDDIERIMIDYNFDNAEYLAEISNYYVYRFGNGILYASNTTGNFYYSRRHVLS